LVVESQQIRRVSKRQIASAQILFRQFTTSIAQYILKNGNLGLAFAETDVSEADLESVIGDLMSGQYGDPVRVVAFNTAKHWAEDASEDVAREIMRRLDLAGHELPSSIQGFVDSHLGPDRQLTLRLARISHRDKRIGAANQRKLFCENDFSMIRRKPRCRQSVAQNGLILESLKGGLWMQRSMPGW
jgi:hypothetical protein